MSELLKGILCVVGVAATAGVTYIFHKKVMEFLGAVIVLGLGVLSYLLIHRAKLDVPWPLVIIGCGVVAGLLSIPCFIISEINDLEKAVA